MKNNEKRINRRNFISTTILGGIGAVGTSSILFSCVQKKNDNLNNTDLSIPQNFIKGISLRPYQLLCAICAIGEGNVDSFCEKIKAIKDDPDIPVTLISNAGDIFAYQDPGDKDDTKESAEFNRKRDLEILQRIDLQPGATLPARVILHRIWDRIENLEGICTCDDKTLKNCESCPKANSGHYEKGRELSLLYATPGWNSQLYFSKADLPKAKNCFLIPRTREERMEEKRKSLEAMYNAEAIDVRPHILMCAICQYGDGAKPPFDTDNLPEMLQHILKNPDAKIRMAEAADWMMCAPCPSMNKHNACINVKGHAGLTSQLRDVRVLQRLELNYGDTINAQELYKRIFIRIPSSALVCGNISKGVQEPSVWDDECGHHSQSLASYAKGRELLIKEFGFSI